MPWARGPANYYLFLTLRELKKRRKWIQAILELFVLGTIKNHQRRIKYPKRLNEFQVLISWFFSLYTYVLNIYLVKEVMDTVLVSV